jgi:hypothetical protein
MYNYNIEQAVDAYNLKDKAQTAFKKVMESANNDNPDIQ